MNQLKTIAVQRVRFVWAEKTAPRKQLKVRLTAATANEDQPSPVKKRMNRFLIRLRSD